MSDKEQQTIFQPFAQADSTTSRRYGGTGLGLVISRQLVEMMSGELTFTSRKGHGSTFAFTVKCRLPQEQDSSEEGKPTAGISSGERIMRGLVLVAEDNKIISDLALRQLSTLGVQGYAVSDGREAVAAASDLEFDLILMDCHLPQMDGYEATRRIREMELCKGRRTPIVAITASISANEEQSCIEAGMDACLNKPITLKRLSDMLCRWLPTESA